MKPDQEKLLASVANARLIHLNEQIVMPLLDSKIQQKLVTLCEAVKADGTVRVCDIAYIAACLDLKQDLDAKARHGERAATKLNFD